MDNPTQNQQPQTVQDLPQGQQPNQPIAPPQQETDLLSWTAPARPFKRRNREFYITIISIAAVAGLVLFLVDGWLPVMLIISLVFLFYVLSTVEPENITYKITNLGVKIATHSIPWSAMRRFWFTRRFENEILVIETFSLTGRLELVINTDQKGQIEKEMKKYLVHEEAPPTFIDKSANWFAKKMPQG